MPFKNNVAATFVVILGIFQRKKYTLRIDILIAGLCNGKVVMFDCADWKIILDQPIFENGILWLNTAPAHSSSSLLFIQARFQGFLCFILN